MDVIENLVDDIRLSNRCDDAQPTTTLGTQLDVDFENSLEALCPGKRSQGTIGIYSGCPFTSTYVLAPFLARRLGVGTTRLRYLALGASTP